MCDAVLVAVQTRLRRKGIRKMTKQQFKNREKKFKARLKAALNRYNESSNRAQIAETKWIEAEEQFKAWIISVHPWAIK